MWSPLTVSCMRTTEEDTATLARFSDSGACAARRPASPAARTGANHRGQAWLWRPEEGTRVRPLSGREGQRTELTFKLTWKAKGLI